VQLPPPPEHHLVGAVAEEDTGKPIARAQIDFEGRDRTGLISKGDGTFESGNIEPGEYKLTVRAEGYKEGSCSAIVEPETKVTGAPPPLVKVINTEVKCALKPAPALGIVEGSLIDAETGAPVIRAVIRVRDERNRILELQSDDKGVFRVENVPAGQVHLTVSADSYLPSDTLLEVKKQVEQHASLVVRKVPKKLSVTLMPKEIKLSKQVLFTGSSAEIAPASQPVIQELAAVLQQHSEVTSVEIQGHTDETGSPAFDKRISLERAQSVRSALVTLGIDGNRLTTTGFGSEKPLAPNTTDANRAKNRRVQLMILSKTAAP
jgi:outer membrane protein OmpA-like peptidoglycan-associated protein